MKDDFAHWLVQRIDSKGWTQAEFARRAEVGPATVSRVISGENNPGLDFLQGAARAFSLPLEEMMRLAGILPQSGELLPEARDWSARLGLLSPEQREAALVAMEAALRVAEVGDRARRGR